MDLRQLEMFKAVAQEGGFTNAGKKLYVSHSAVSRQIRLLEEELQCALFTRSHGKVLLTEPGKIFLAGIHLVFEQLSKATEAVAAVSKPQSRRLNIGTATTMLQFFLPQILERYEQMFPDVVVSVKTGHTGHLIEDIRTGTLDLGIVTLPFNGQDFAIRPLYREELVLALGKRHPLAGRRVVQVHEISNCPMVVFPRDSSTRKLLDDFFHGIGIFPPVHLELDNDEAVERVLTADRTVAFLPRQRAKADRIPFVRLAGYPIYREIVLTHLASRHLPDHMSQFFDLCCRRAESFGLELAPNSANQLPPVCNRFRQANETCDHQTVS